MCQNIENTDLLKYPNILSTKRDNKKELNNFREVTERIAKLLEHKVETIIASDVNIDLQAISLDEDKKTQYQKTQARLLEVFKENLLNKGAVLMNKKPTFKRGEYESQLDCILTNKPDKLTDNKQFDSVSDHQLIFATRKMKRMEEKLIITRNWNKINVENIDNDILNHKLFKQTLLENSSNKISENIVQIMNEVYDSYAPLKKRKIKAKENLTNDPIVKEAINNRDRAYKTMKRTKTHESELNFKNIKTNTRLLIKKLIKKGKKMSTLNMKDPIKKYGR